MNNWQKLQGNNTMQLRSTTMAELPNNLYKWLKKECWKQKKKNNFFNYDLVGHIKEEYAIPEWIEEFEDFIVKKSLEGYSRNWYEAFAFNTEDRPIILQNLWCNFQKKHEFNPPHTHGGVMSFVIFVKIPYDLSEEDKVFPDIKFEDKGNKSTATTSRFMFMNTDFYGIFNEVIDVDKSFESKLFIFPSKQYHQVFPFYTSDDYRITVSGNLKYSV